MAGEKKDPAFLFYVTAWLQSESVRAMSLEQRGAYVELLCFAWLNGSVPADEKSLRNLLGVSAAKFAAIWSGLSSKWEPMPDGPGRLINRRLEHERSERRRKADEMRARGQAGGQRSAEQRASRGQADRQAESKPSTSTSTSTSNSPSESLGAAAPEVPEKPGKEEIPRPDDVTEAVWRDWLAHRRRKRATVTLRVIETTRAVAAQAGMTLDAALAHWVAQGHVGFFPPKPGEGGTPRRQALATRVGTDFAEGPQVSTF